MDLVQRTAGESQRMENSPDTVANFFNIRLILMGTSECSESSPAAAMPSVGRDSFRLIISIRRL